MSSLTSASTLAQIKAAYADNASYQEDADVAKARAFVTACRLLLLKTPSKVMHGKAGGIEFSVASIQQQLDAANRWLACSLAAADGGGITFPSFDGFRGM